MSIIHFGNRGGWVRWRTMDTAERERQEGRTAEVIADMLADPRRINFPDFPVVLDGAEVEWEICDIALDFARNMRGDMAMTERWLACLLRALRYVDGQRAAFLRGGDPPPVSPGPSGLQRERDRAALERLEVPLVLVTPRRAPPSAKPGQVAQVYPPPT